jgi:hypothetical protein
MARLFNWPFCINHMRDSYSAVIRILDVIQENGLKEKDTKLSGHSIKQDP